MRVKRGREKKDRIGVAALFFFFFYVFAGATDSFLIYISYFGSPFWLLVSKIEKRFL